MEDAEEIRKQYEFWKQKNDAIEAKEQKEELKARHEAEYKQLVELTKPFIGQPPVTFEGDLSEHYSDYNYGERYVQEFNDYLDNLPCLGYSADIWPRGARLRITVEVIGPVAGE